MFTVVITEKSGAQRKLQFDKAEVTIGRVQGNDVILPKGNVSKRHSRLVLKDGRYIIVDLKSTNGTFVNGRKLTSPLVVKSGDKMYIGDFILHIEDAEGGARDSVSSGSPLPPRVSSDSPQRSASIAASASIRPSLMSTAEAPLTPEPPAPEEPEEDFEDGATSKPRNSASLLAKANVPVGRSAVPHRSESPSRSAMPAYPSSAAGAQGATSSPQIRVKLSRGPRPGAPVATDMSVAFRYAGMRVRDNYDVDNPDPYAIENEERWNSAQQAIRHTLTELTTQGLLDATLNQEELSALVLREVVTFGALDTLLSDSTVREIVVQGLETIHADNGRGLKLIEGGFSCPENLLTVARRLLAQGHEVLDFSKPIQTATLPDGTHVTVIQPPVAARGLIIEIRRGSAQPPSGAELVAQNVISEEMLELFQRAVTAKRNIVVAGSPGSGVTTLLNVLIGLCPEHERVVTIERTPTLVVDRARTLSLRSSRTSNDTLMQAQSMRADRLVVDGAAAENLSSVLYAMAERRVGSFLGVHATSAADLLEALQLFSHLAGREPAATAALIAQAANLVIHIHTNDDGSHRVESVAEITHEADQVAIQELYTHKGGEFKATAKAASYLKGL